jgi:diaminopropionate ammonia-lyase family
MLNRRELLRNPFFENTSLAHLDPLIAEQVFEFHQRLPLYEATRLMPLPSIAEEIGVKSIYLKEESNRFGLPSFKILGAAWGTVNAITKRLGLTTNSDLQLIKEEAQKRRIALFAATDGNHGRAVARMGGLLGVAVEIYVPRDLHSKTKDLIRDEGANVIQLDKSYDELVKLAFENGTEDNAVVVQDTSFAGYEEIPQVGAQFLIQGDLINFH